MVKNAIHGIGAMPPKGGNPSLSDFEVERAVVYIANQSAASFEEPKEPAGDAPPDEARPPEPPAAPAPPARPQPNRAAPPKHPHPPPPPPTHPQPTPPATQQPHPTTQPPKL